MKFNELNDNDNTRPIVKYIIAGLLAAGVIGGSVFGVYKYTNNLAGQNEDAVDASSALSAPDTLTAEDVTDPESMEVKVDEEDADIVNLEMTGEPDDATVETTEVQQENSETSTSTETAKNYEVEYYDESKTMYAIRNVNIRKGPDSKDFDKVASLSTNDSIKVVGVVEKYNGEDTFWLAVEYKGEEYYISGAYLSDSKVAVSSSGNTSSNNSTSSSNNTSSNNSTQSSGNSSGFTPEQQAILDKLKNGTPTDFTTITDTTNNGTQVTEGGNWGN